MIYLQLFWEFFKIGLFAIGGGLATLPFLQELADRTGWYTTALISDMIAISESTPGPIGINMATYVGCNIAGFWGGVMATLGEITPSIIIVCILATSLDRFRNNALVNHAFYGLRPAVTGLIAAAGVSIVQVSLFHLDAFAQSGQLLDLLDIPKLIYFGVVYVAIKKLDKHPIVYIAISAVVGIVLAF